MDRRRAMHPAGSLLLAAVASVAGTITIPAETPQARLQLAPAAMGMAGETDIYVLLKNGAVMRLDVRGSRQPQQVFQVPRPFQAYDLAVTGPATDPVLCIPVVRSEKGRLAAWLLQRRALSRVETWAWLPMAGVYTAVALAPQSSTAYVVNASSREVYSVGLGTDRPKVQYVGSVDQARQPGPSVFDARRRLLFVADIYGSSVHQLDVRARRARPATARMKGSEIRALTLHPTDGRLYIADSESRAVWVASPSASPVLTRRFSRDGLLEAPTGVIVAAGGQVWVAEERASAVVRLSADGTRIEQTLKW